MASNSAAGGGQPSRLMILKMQVENFKSYGGTKEIGPFHKCFSSVVGPNGSGKSNVIDAMLFVFGKKTAKLRLNKLSELIHKSAEYPNLPHATVTVFFQSIVDTVGDEDAYDVVPGSQFTVSRVAHKDNRSVYYIDGTTSSFTEVTALLRGKGIDLDHNRFLILQGEVELISQMKPKATTPGEEGLLEYLEDIIGSNVFVEKIEEQSKVVEALTEARADKIKRVQVAEKEKTSLESAKQEAESLLAKDREVLRAQGAYTQAVLAQHKVVAEAALAKLATTEASREKAATELHTAEAAGDALEKTVKTSEGELKKAVEVQSGAKAAMEALEARDLEIKAEATAAKQAAKRGEETVNQQFAALEAAKKAGEAASRSIPDLQASVAKMEVTKVEEQGAHDAVMASLEGETEVLRKQLDAATALQTPKNDAHQAATTAVVTVRNELRFLKERLEEARKVVSALREKEEQYGKEVVGKQKDRAGLQAELDKANARLTALTAEIKAAEESEKATEASLNEARGQLEEAKAAIAGSEGAAGAQRNPVAEALASAAAKGGPLVKAGLYGRVGTLGTIDDKYDCAVTTACGSLNSYVVDSVQGAQACVKFLAESKAGRAKFLILEKITPDMVPLMDRRLETPEGVPRLFDLVKAVDPRFRAAFYYGLRDTLVADNIDQARRIAFPKDPTAPRWRVVTLNGELLETSGTMSGGGGQPRRGGLTGGAQSSKAGQHAGSAAEGVSQADVDGLNAQVGKLQNQLMDVRQRKGHLKTEQADLEKRARPLPNKIKQLDTEVAALQAMKEDKAKEIAKASSAAAATTVSAADLGKLDELTSQVKMLEEVEAAARAEVQTAELRVKALKSQITEVGGEKVAKAKARLDRASEQLSSKEKELGKAQAEAKGSKAAADKAEVAMEKAKVEAQSAAERFGKLKQEINKLTADAEPVSHALAEAASKVAAATAGVEAARAELDKFHQSIRSLKKADADAEVAWKEAKEGADKAGKAVKVLLSRLQKFAGEYKDLMEQYIEQVTETVADEEGPLVDGEEAGGDAVMEGAGAGSGGVPVPRPDLAERVRSRIKEAMDLPILTPQECAAIHQERQQAVIATLEAERESLRSKVNMQAIKEYRLKEKEYLKRVAELESTTRARDESRRIFDQLRKDRLDRFMDGFSKIGLKLKEMYQMITLGGDAELELEDSLDPFEGIRFSVRPPKKSWKAIANLSGGEKTLSSLALVFALHHFKPTPLYVMDEIDAALDFKNVSIVANYIKERTKNAQFIIISLRNNMFELADRLVGIYKTADVTKSVTINPKAIAAACNVLSGQENTGPAGGEGAGKVPAGAGAGAGSGKPMGL